MSPNNGYPYVLQMDAGVLGATCRPAVVWAAGIDPPLPSEAMSAFLEPLLERVIRAGEAFIAPERHQRVRKMLRHGKYHPSGRGKPSSEYLLRAALEQAFPSVTPPVDVTNAISLESGLPASIFDAALTGSKLQMRHGHPGETFVFNNAGQSIDLEDLLLVCRRQSDDWVPCGNPVKDAMATKISSRTTDVVAVLYVPADEPLSVGERWASAFSSLLAEFCHADSSGYHVVEQAEAGRPDDSTAGSETVA